MRHQSVYKGPLCPYNIVLINLILLIRKSGLREAKQVAQSQELRSVKASPGTQTGLWGKKCLIP